MVYYRKYRPQTISELDLASVREKLTTILSSNEIPHAFLFTGSKGLGKTSSARILAKAINCLTPNGIEPCNKCDICVGITSGSNIDVLEIDAASNGGVEEIRILRERVKFASATLKKKVYIIDEVHMLSTGAFNALLKTLEEPPSHVVFVLATTELHKLPPTVVSRTFQVQFEKPTEEELVHSLSRIVEGEKLKIDTEVLGAIFLVADGSFRDGAKILEELSLSSKGKTITKDLFENTFHIKGIDDEVTALLHAYAVKDAKVGLQTINKLYETGADFKIVTEKLVDHLRGLLMLRNEIESDVLDIPGFTSNDIKKLLELTNIAYGELRMSVIPQLPLELMTVKYCIIDSSSPVHQPLTTIQETEVTSQKSANKDLQTHTNLLKDLIVELNIINKPGAALLRSCKKAVLDKDRLVISTPFPIHAERLKSDKVFSDLLRAVDTVLRKKVEVTITVSSN